jgi:diguanylate cyclase (GGDEF)-like protein
MTRKDGQNRMAWIWRMPLPGRILLLAVIYFTAARLSLILAIPPGYATAVWPPSGIALAALLLLGNRAWPGAWLGASLVNLTVAQSPALAIVIATGNTLEALAGAALVRRFIGIPRRFERGREVVIFVVIAAASCAIAATVAVAGLAIGGSVSPPEIFHNWWTWWQGDLTGIIIVAPLILSWSLRRAAPWPLSKRLESVAFALLLLAVTFLAFHVGDAAPPSSLFSLTFAIMPFMIWAALRFSQRVVTTATVVSCAFAVYYTVEDARTLAPSTLNELLLTLLAFVSAVVVAGLVLSAVMVERSRAVERLSRALADLQEQAVTDPLTGLYNRRYLRDFLQREWIRAKRRDGTLAVIMIDLDHFKRINDTYGHEMGDFVLTAVAALLRTHIRSSDIVCRYGGEEFALVLPDAAPDTVLRRAEDIREAIGRLELNHRGVPIDRVTASLGVALFPGRADGPDTLLRASDEALYAAKGAGRDRVVTAPGI